MGIISDRESRQILKNHLIRQARQRYADQLESAGSDEREKIMSQIEGEVEKELRRRGLGGRWGVPSDSGLLH